MNKIIISCFLLVFCISILTLAHSQEKQVNFSKPPESIKNWYQPDNKHQIWLHTMFNLRRQMQAIAEYVAYEDASHLNQWVSRFAKTYQSIGKMVPQWQDELEMEWLNKMIVAAKVGDYKTVLRAQRKIRQSCGGCHKEYKIAVAALYRTPNFDTIKVEDSNTLEELDISKSMNGMSNMMNRMLIALTDGYFERAQNAWEIFQHRLEDITTICHRCHKTDRQKNYIMGEHMMTSFDKLSSAIAQKQAKQAKNQIAKIAVNVCAKCHAIHRTLDDIRRELSR